MVRQDIILNRHKEIMKDLEERLKSVLLTKKYRENLTLGDVLTVWQRVMSKLFRNGVKT